MPIQLPYGRDKSYHRGWYGKRHHEWLWTSNRTVPWTFDTNHNDIYCIACDECTTTTTNNNNSGIWNHHKKQRKENLISVWTIFSLDLDCIRNKEYRVNRHDSSDCQNSNTVVYQWGVTSKAGRWIYTSWGSRCWLRCGTWRSGHWALIWSGGRWQNTRWCEIFCQRWGSRCWFYSGAWGGQRALIWSDCRRQKNRWCGGLCTSWGSRCCCFCCCRTRSGQRTLNWTGWRRQKTRWSGDDGAWIRYNDSIWIIPIYNQLPWA